MPSYAHLQLTSPCACPGCGEPLSYELVAFQWGYCPRYLPDDDLLYALGDAILWRVDDAGRIPRDTFFESPRRSLRTRLLGDRSEGEGRSGQDLGANVGDPALKHVLVRGYAAVSGDELACGRCRLTGLALDVCDGRIVGLRAAVPGCDVALCDASGGVTPVTETGGDGPFPFVEVRGRALARGDAVIVPGKKALWW